MTIPKHEPREVFDRAIEHTRALSPAIPPPEAGAGTNCAMKSSRGRTIRTGRF